MSLRPFLPVLWQGCRLARFSGTPSFAGFSRDTLNVAKPSVFPDIASYMLQISVFFRNVPQTVALRHENRAVERRIWQIISFQDFLPHICCKSHGNFIFCNVKVSQAQPYLPAGSSLSLSRARHDTLNAVKFCFSNGSAANMQQYRKKEKKLLLLKGFDLLFACATGLFAAKKSKTKNFAANIQRSAGEKRNMLH